MREQAIDLEFTVRLDRLHRHVPMPLEAASPSFEEPVKCEFPALDSGRELAQFRN